MSKSSSDFEEKVASSVAYKTQCTHCNETYRVTDPSSQHIPLILKCYHSCCERCIRDSILRWKGVVCGTCGFKSVPKPALDPAMKNLRVSFPVAENIVNEIRKAEKRGLQDESQINFTLNRLQRKNVNMIQPISNKIAYCHECEFEVPSFKCLQCGTILCEGCNESCHDKKTLRHHKRIPLADAEDAASVATDSSSAVFFNVEELEHGQILQQLFSKSEVKMHTIENSLRALTEKRAMYTSIGVNYDEIEKKLMDYFEQAFNMLTRKRAEVLKNLNEAKDSWQISAKIGEKHLKTLHTNLTNVTKRLRKIVSLESVDDVSVTEHMKRIREFLEREDSVNFDFPKQPQKEFQLSFKWFEELERECDFDFGSSGAVLLVKAEEDSGALDFGDMMHPNYDYSNENYDIGNDFQCSPDIYSAITINTENFLSHSVGRTPSLASDGAESRSASSYHSSADVFASRGPSQSLTFKGPASKKGSLASQISSSTSSVASGTRNGHVENHNQSHSMKSHTIYSSKYNSSKMANSYAPSDNALPCAVTKKKNINFFKLEDIRRILSKTDTFPNVRVCHIVDPTDFYVQIHLVDTYFEAFRDEFSAAPKWPVPSLSDIPRNTVCITAGPKDCRDRVRVEDHEKNSTDEKASLIHVFYLDNGSRGKVPLSALRVPKLRKLKIAESSPLAVHCCLYDCFPPKKPVWENDVINYFISCIKNKKVDLEIKKPTPIKLEVDLHVRGDFSSSVRQLLLDSGNATICSQKHHVIPLHFSDESVYLYDTDFKPQDWIDIKVSHIVSPCNFYAQRSTSVKALHKLGKSMDAFYKNEKNLKDAAIINPFIGQIIAAKYHEDNRWYRASIVNINPLSKRKFFVRYVDYGNEASVSERSIARLAHEFFQITVQAFKCTLRDILPLNGTWQDNAIKVFQSLVEDVVLKMVVQEIKADGLSVSLYKNAGNVGPTQTDPLSVQKILIHKGLARGVGELAGIKSAIRKPKSRSKKNVQRSVDSNNKAENSETVITGSTSQLGTATDDQSSEVLDEEPFNVAFDEMENTGEHGPPRRTSEVKIERIANSKNVFLHFLHKCPDAANMSSDLKIFYDNPKNNEAAKVETVTVGEKYAVFLEEDSEWCRGVVVSCSDDNDEVEVDLRDYVELKKTVTKDNIRKLSKKFANQVDSVLKSTLVEFDEEEEDWSPEFIDQVKAELAKYKEVCAETRGRDSGSNSLNVVLWGRIEKDVGPLEPRDVKWTNFNRKLLKMKLNEDDDISDSSPHSLKPRIEYIQLLNEESDKIDTKAKIAQWLDGSREATGGGTNYSDLINHNKIVVSPEVENPESDTTIKDEDVDENADENVDSVSTIDPETRDWLDAPALDKNRFVAKPTYVDWDFNVTMQLVDGSCMVKLIEDGLKTVFENSKPSPDDLHWRPGQICIARWVDDKWYRARVIEVNSTKNEVKVEYVDYGGDAFVPPSSLRKRVALVDYPCQCYTFPIRSDILPTSEDGKWTEDKLAMVQKTIVDFNCEVFLWKEPGEDFYRIEKLMIPGVSCDLFTYLISLTVATKKEICRPPKRVIDRVQEESENEDDERSTTSSDSSISAIERVPDQKQLLRLLKEDLEEAKAPINCWDVPQCTNDNSLLVSYFDVPKNETPLVVKVTEVLSVTEIVINVVSSDSDPAIEEGYKMYQKMTEELQKEAAEFPELNPPYPGRICCTQFEDGIWYRGLVIDRRGPNNCVPVFYIDYGNVSYTPVSELRELKADWYHIPMQSVKCTIDDIDLPESKSEIQRLGEDLSNTLMNKEFSAVIKESGTDKTVYSIRLLDEDDVPLYHSILRSQDC